MWADIKIGWRNLHKNKIYTIILIFGMSVSMVSGFVIYNYVQFQRSYEDFHEHATDIYQVVYDLHLAETEHSNGSSFAIYEALKNDFPEVHKAAYAYERQSLTLGYGDNLHELDQAVSYVNSDWFDLFELPWLSGIPTTLDAPGNIALTQSLATVIFGANDPIGEILRANSGDLLRVVGVIDDTRTNTNLKAKAYVSLETLKVNLGRNTQFFTLWGYFNSTSQVYVNLRDRNQVEKITDSLNARTERYFGESASVFKLQLLPLLDRHFEKKYGGAMSHQMLWLLSAMGLSIFIVAALNYVNLTIVQYYNRSREVGIRKVLGASGVQLTRLLIVESAMISAVSTGLALVMMPTAILVVNNFLLQNSPITANYDFPFILTILLCWAFVTLIMGIYPALKLSRTPAVSAMRSDTTGIFGDQRKYLLTFQNVICIVLTISCIVTFSQIRFMQSTDLGFDRREIVIIGLPATDQQQRDQLSNLLKQLSAVDEHSYCYRAPTLHGKRGGTFRFDDRADFESWPARSSYADSSFIHVFGIPLLAGRNFRTEAVVPEYLVNRQFVMQLGYDNEDSVLGKSLLAGGMHDNKNGIIVGVVGDYSTQKLDVAIEPTVIGYSEPMLRTLVIKLEVSQTETIMAPLETIWKQHFPNELLKYSFLDEQIEQLYHEDKTQVKVIAFAAGLTVLISNLGLLGLMALTVLKRKKEIGVRKVLGASVIQVLILVCKDAVKLIVVAMLIASPIAWWAMNTWLAMFAYRIEMGWEVFGITGSLVVSITLLTVGGHAFRAAKANPVDSLRDE